MNDIEDPEPIPLTPEELAEGARRAAELTSSQLERIKQMMETPDLSHEIFVFGSNLAGIHGAGSAEAALKKHGAIWGVGVGLQGNSYAIPTKDKELQSLPLLKIRDYVAVFLTFASINPQMTFNVVKIGCGLAGFTEQQMAPLFAGAPSNVNLPEGW